MIPFKANIWISRSTAFNDLMQSSNVEEKDIVIICVFGLSMVMLALIGFGFYLWNLKSSDEHTQSRLLNILHGYLSVACLGCSPAVFNFMLQLKVQRPYTVLSYSEPSENKLFFWSVRVTFVHFIAISVLFLLISLATVMNHFKPGLYLDISLAWRHKIAIPFLLILFTLTEITFQSSCNHLNRVFKCEAVKTRTLVIIPATLISFLCQVVVVVDDIWSWKRIYQRVRRFFRPNIVTPIHNVEMLDLTTNHGQNIYNPSHYLNQHAEFISLSTRFLTLCVFNMIVFLIGILTTVFEVFNFAGQGFAWLVAMAITPTIWITRNKKMKEKFLRGLFRG